MSTDPIEQDTATLLYPKIETLYDRADNFAVDTSRIRCPEFQLINSWIVTEKIDGTNIRVSLELTEGGWARVIRGRTDNAQIPASLYQVLEGLFPVERLQSLWRPDAEGNERAYPLALYGEGYGEKIQSGGDYRAGQGFRLFDVLVGGLWLSWENVGDVAGQLDIATVDAIPGVSTIEAATEMVRSGFDSPCAASEGKGRVAEGVVAKTSPPLLTAQGRRLMWKLKAADFRGRP